MGPFHLQEILHAGRMIFKPTSFGLKLGATTVNRANPNPTRPVMPHVRNPNILILHLLVGSREYWNVLSVEIIWEIYSVIPYSSQVSKALDPKPDPAPASARFGPH